jgi:hypothetical protein
MKSTYAKPSIVSSEYQQQKLEGTRASVITADGRPILYFRSAPPEEPVMWDRMRDLGVNVPACWWADYVLYSQAKGEALDTALRNNFHEPERQVRIVDAAVKQIARIHSIGYSHIHPHLKNLIWDGSKAWVIDFDRARPHGLDFEKDDAAKIAEELEHDFRKFFGTSQGLGLMGLHNIRYPVRDGNGQRVEEYFPLKEIVRNYPMPPKRQDELVSAFCRIAYRWL